MVAVRFTGFKARYSAQDCLRRVCYPNWGGTHETDDKGPYGDIPYRGTRYSVLELTRSYRKAALMGGFFVSIFWAHSARYTCVHYITLGFFLWTWCKVNRLASSGR